jgi:hypothetical protein
LGGGAPHHGLDYDAEQCQCGSHTKDGPPLTEPQRIIDLHGAHARSNCPNCKAGTCYAHNTCKDIIREAGVSAGLKDDNEPTFDTLLSKLGPTVMSRVFPKHPSAATTQKSCDIITEMFDIDAMDMGPERELRQTQLDGEIDELPPSKGLRLDVNLTDTSMLRPGAIIDVGTVHPFAASNWNAERKVAMQRAAALALDPLAIIPDTLKASPSMQAYAADKTLLYKPLMHAIALQHEHGHRFDHQPTFVPLIVSTLGTITGFGPLKCLLRDALTLKLEAMGPRDDASTIPSITGAVLHDLCVSLISTTQRGLARSMLAAGRPYSGGRGGGGQGQGQGQGQEQGQGQAQGPGQAGPGQDSSATAAIDPGS